MPTPDGGWRGARVSAAVAFVFALGLALLATIVLAIVGAPLSLVEAVAPLAAIFATLAFALLLGAPGLLAYAAVGRQAGALAAALAFAIALGGIGLALSGAGDLASGPPIVVGGAALAFLVGPRARFGGVLSDVLATRISFWPLRAAFALVFLAVGALTAMAGVVVAQSALDQALGAPAKFTDALIGGALALSVLTGGALSLVWVDAASAAFVALALIGAAGFARLKAPNSALSFPLTPPDSLWAALALVAAIATFAPSAIALGASGSLPRALKVAGAGLAISLGALAASSIASPWVTGSGLGLEPARRTLLALVGLALARQGLFVAVRAFGFNLRLDPQRIANTASARLARLRLATLVLSAALVMGARASGQTPATMMMAALALSLGLTAPSIILALTTQGGAIACALALLLGIANFLRGGRLPHSLSDLTVSLAAQGAVAALLAGFVAAWLLPDKNAGPPVGDDLFE